VIDKTCSTCKTLKHISCFGKDKRSKNGLRSECKDCLKVYMKEYYQSNKLRLNAKNREYALENHQKISSYKRGYDDKNREKLNSQKRKWATENKGYYAHKSAERRCYKLDATPPWSDLEKIKVIYTACQKITESTKKEHHVDHIVPLKGENVCGLHVWWNLRIIPAKMNLSKGNKVENIKGIREYLERDKP
jgi:hypothetical protein